MLTARRAADRPWPIESSATARNYRP